MRREAEEDQERKKIMDSLTQWHNKKSANARNEINGEAWLPWPTGTAPDDDEQSI